MTVLGCGRQPEPESNVPDALTGIHGRIHCAATPGTTGLDEHETEFDRIAIDNLLNTLTEIALAIARRREQLDQ
jgi:hypothetical protein